jgi:hypothetical protein
MNEFNTKSQIGKLNFSSCIVNYLEIFISLLLNKTKPRNTSHRRLI